MESSTEAPAKDFNSEHFKIELKNLPPFGFGEIKKFLKKLNLNPVKVKAVKKKGITGQIAYVCFKNDENKIEALEKLNGYIWKRKTITANPATAVMDPMQKHRIENQNAISNVSCRLATAPLADTPYNEQLLLKENDLLNILKDYGNQMKKINNNLLAKISEEMKLNNGLPCKWLGLKPSPLINAYRNKSEFTIGKNALGEKVIGFRTGSYIEGSVEVCSVDDLPHIPDEMKHAAKIFEKYIQASALDVFNPETRTGIFRQLTVRFSKSTREIMLIVGLNIQENDELFAELKTTIVAFFTDKEGIELNLTSLYIQLLNKKVSGDTTNPWIHIYGRENITDILCGYKFRISPSSFFQINTEAAEVLYQSAIELAKPTADTTVLDICCGTGSIGICFSKHCANVLGVELNADAIHDAEFNAAENGIENCKFYAGNCDDYIDTLVHEAKTDDIVAIIDPPRAGLHARSISSLRNTRGLKRFIYISCSPKDALRNWIDLGRNPSKSYKGDPFVPVAAVAVDMFPHTKHTELVLHFERINI